MTSTNKKQNNTKLISAGWLLFSIQQAFVGYLLLTHFTSYLVIFVGLVSLSIAFVIIGTHFYEAHK